MMANDKTKVYEEKVDNTTWCLACKGYTFNANGFIALTKNGKPRFSSECTVCGKGKSRMLPMFG